MKDERLSLSLGGSGGEAVPPCQQAWPPYIWNHITPNKSVCNAQFLLKSIRKEKTSPAAKFKSAFSGWHRARCVFTPLCIITNHIRFCWAYECNDQSEAFRWVIAETLLFRHRTHWLTEFTQLETTKWRCTNISKRFSHSVNSFIDYNGSFWECLNSLDWSEKCYLIM